LYARPVSTTGARDHLRAFHRLCLELPGSHSATRVSRGSLVEQKWRLVGPWYRPRHGSHPPVDLRGRRLPDVAMVLRDLGAAVRILGNREAVAPDTERALHLEAIRSAIAELRTVVQPWPASDA
jgi:hypothetical protein